MLKQQQTSFFKRYKDHFILMMIEIRSREWRHFLLINYPLLKHYGLAASVRWPTKDMLQIKKLLQIK